MEPFPTSSAATPEMRGAERSLERHRLHGSCRTQLRQPPHLPVLLLGRRRASRGPPRRKTIGLSTTWDSRSTASLPKCVQAFLTGQKLQTKTATGYVVHTPARKTVPARTCVVCNIAMITFIDVTFP
ncbi:hypothetical protein TGRUB_230667 [Toxoplasma gondii RUB]|uniref:Uncharacterized protein n=9 Tax=Toxoplasma gondii TaxID=5811 RepID=S7WB66_TOXGG|nr:hypothetical protein TGGT1_230667 [Toxoplasma gondii GT1]KAF4641696.1 hypothetical protein TGRH88_075060 [Toxoplasma gondii]KFG48316.1 hypothetical protein TGDOM2_230667 [Toxoplasma gondii GAB2-2007-GAL-DOM2]KFG55491.1 hypothetical protein TGFOU_230667 [Toxoplasma gondii FOU]KFG63613.1 hypothetical protein TGRUB_230667 [Toxoplasma gondii RUB]KFH11010.1 hypothetical protein TGVAND_230667 [Toxoplasma gondii VAND]KFH17517.1 hypothetical protein TGMAS_230667 [Toxoplasma gondii MAS]PUA92825.1 